MKFCSKKQWGHESISESYIFTITIQIVHKQPVVHTVRAWGHYHPEFPVKDSHTHRDIIKIMHDAEYKSISLQKEEEWQRTQVTITASLFRTRIPPSSGTLSVLNSHLGWNSNHYHWWQQQLRICRFFSFSVKRQKNTEILFTKEEKGQDTHGT